MFKKRSLLSFRRPKSVVVEGSPKPRNTLVLSTPPLPTAPIPSPNAEDSRTRFCAEPLFHEDFITPTREPNTIDDQFVDHLSARNPEVNQFIQGLKADSHVPSAQDNAPITEDDYDDYTSLTIECVTIEDVGISYPSGSVKMIDHDPWSFAAESHAPYRDFELKIPALSPHRRLASSDSGSSFSSASDTTPSTPQSAGWPLPDSSSRKVGQHTKISLVEL